MRKSKWRTVSLNRRRAAPVQFKAASLNLVCFPIRNPKSAICYDAFPFERPNTFDIMHGGVGNCRGLAKSGRFAELKALNV